jgi:hypothetical protein
MTDFQKALVNFWIAYFGIMSHFALTEYINIAGVFAKNIPCRNNKPDDFLTI